MKSIAKIVFLLSILILTGCQRHKTSDNSQKSISNDQMIKVNKYLVERDNELIEAYAKRRNWDMKTSGTGLWYIIWSKGSGEKALKGKTAEINYKVELLDGTLCYSSDSLGTKKFQIGKGLVEAGLDEGILMMQEGDKARFIMPPHLAYNLIGDENKIPARATIVYHVELLKIYED